jgi:hypothetical protein
MTSVSSRFAKSHKFRLGVSLIAACLLLLATLSSSDAFPAPGSVEVPRPPPSVRGVAQPAMAQTGTACTWTLSSTTSSVGAGGGDGTVTVNTQQGCPWTAVSVSDWITITSAGSGTGTGTVSFTMAPASAPRAGRIEVAGQNFAVYQEFGSCGTPLFSVSSHDAGYSSDAIEGADLNGDGLTDLVLTNQGVRPGNERELSVLLSDGAGRFNTSEFDSGLRSPAFSLGDFDGDDRPDIAMAGGSYVRIFYNDGAGRFGQSYADVAVDGDLQLVLRRLMPADVNHDGKLDLVIATTGRTASGESTSGALILVGDGAGGFTQKTLITTDWKNWLEGVADTDSDGALDLLFPGGPSDQTQLTVMRGDGLGGFGPPLVTASIASIFPRAFAVADFDTDNRLDVVSLGIMPTPSSTPPGPTHTRVIQILSGDGTGHFTQKSLTADKSIAVESSLVVADFNSDGKVDVAYSIRGNVTVRLGDGAGGLGAPLTTETVGRFGSGSIVDLAVGDIDGDSRPDLAGADYSRGAVVLRNNCTAAPHIAGRVTDSLTAGGLPGVTINLSGPQPATTQTDEGGNYFFGALTAGADYVVTPSKENYRFVPASASVNGLTDRQTADFVATAMTVQCAQEGYVVDESAGSVRVEVLRSGDTSGPATVGYTAGDSLIPIGPGRFASERSDYTYAAGTLHFAPGETTKNIIILLTDDGWFEFSEVIPVRLSDPSGAMLGWSASCSVLITANDNVPEAGNPISDSQFFVRQHYLDFLNREPDAAGLKFWMGEIEQCGADARCREVKRIHVSAAFFLSIEFQQTGYLVYRTYQAAFGTGEALRAETFLKGTQEIGRGVVVGQGEWQAQLAANQQGFFSDFVLRPEFLTAYPTTLAPAQFVDALNANTGGSLSRAERDSLDAALGSGAITRAGVLRAVAENEEFSRRQLTRAFVLMQYFGYLRRGPAARPDRDFTGYNFWLTKLNQFNGSFVEAEMVKAFLNSIEYRQRFGRP